MKWMRFASISLFVLALGFGSLAYTACGSSTSNNTNTQDGGTTKNTNNTNTNNSSTDAGPTSKPGG